MKSFNNFITENKKNDTPSREDIEKLQRMTRETTSSSSSERIRRSLDSATERKGRTKRTVPSSRVISTPEGSIVTNIPPGSGKTPEEQISRAERKSNPRGTRASDSQVRDYAGKMRDSGARSSIDMDATAQRPTVRRTAGTEPRKPLKPGTFVVDTSASKKTPQTQGVRQSDVSVKAADYRKKFARGTQGPSAKLRTPAQQRTYLTGVKKGYFDPRTGRITTSGIQKHVNMRAVGGENFGKMKGADPRGELSRVSNIVQRAQSGDRAARSEVRRSYKAITKKYQPQTGNKVTPTSRSFKVFQQQATNINAPKLEPPKKMPIPSAPSTGSSSGSSTQTATKTRTKTPTLNLGTPPVTTSAPTKGGELAPGTKSGQVVAPSRSTATSSPSRQTTYTGIGGGKKIEVAGGTKTPTATTNLLPPGQTAGPKRTNRPQEVKIPLPKKPSELVNKVEQGLSGAKLKYPNPSAGARRLVGLKQAGRGLGRVAGPAFAAWDAYDVYRSERERGQTKERATKAAIAKAGGGWAGSAAGAAAGAKLGGAIGTLAGPIGTAVGAGLGGLAGGVLGYMGGEKIGSAVLGASKKDKDWMKWANRKNQTGTAAANVTSRSGNRAIVKDKEGKERVGYLAYKDGKEVFKTANDPKSLQYTSSNPLERLGRTFLPGMYKAKDEEARKNRVAALKASASK